MDEKPMYHVGCKKDFFVEVLIFLSLALYKHPAAIWPVPHLHALFFEEISK